MKKVIITATLTMTVFSAVPLVTPAQAFAASKPAQIHVVEEAPSATAEQSLDFIEADAALATYNSGSLDTISGTNSMTTKGASSVPKTVKIWNKNGNVKNPKLRVVKVKNLTVDQAVSLWMDTATRAPGKILRGGDILMNGGRNYAIHLTDGTREDLRNALINKLSQGLSGEIRKSAIALTKQAMAYNHYGKNSYTDISANQAAQLYKTRGIVIMRGVNGFNFDRTYWLAKCVVQCSKDMNLAQYENEDSARRDKDVSFAVMEWCRKRAYYHPSSNKTTCRSLLSGQANGMCESLANFVDQVASAYGVKIAVIGSESHAINVLKAGGKYYYMDFQGNNVVCDINSSGYYASPYTHEYSQLLQELQKLDLPQTANWDVVTEKVNSASPELHALADTVVKQMEAKDPQLGMEKNSDGSYTPWQTYYSSALRFFICNYMYQIENKLQLADRLYDDDIMNGRVGRGEANWLTFNEDAGMGENQQYKQTPYGRILGGYRKDNKSDHNVLGFKTEKALLHDSFNAKRIRKIVPSSKFSNVHVTGN